MTIRRALRGTKQRALEEKVPSILERAEEKIVQRLTIENAIKNALKEKTPSTLERTG